MNIFKFQNKSFLLQNTEKIEKYNLNTFNNNKNKAIFGAIGFEPKRDTNLFITAKNLQKTKPNKNIKAFIPKNTISSKKLIPNIPGYKKQLEEILKIIKNSETNKIVSSRKIILYLKRHINIDQIFNSLVQENPNSNNFYLKNLNNNTILFGSTPELVISKKGNKIYANPLAGTIERSLDPKVDKKNALLLENSAKDQIEHYYLVQHYKNILNKVCSSVSIPDKPLITSTKYAWHLSSPINGILSKKISSIDLMLLLHPTPAIGTYPVDNVLRIINKVEKYKREFYSGCIGWQNINGDGSWYLTIRSGQYDIKNNTISAYAGGGIVENSNVETELQETKIKLKTILNIFN